MVPAVARAHSALSSSGIGCESAPRAGPFLVRDEFAKSCGLHGSVSRPCPDKHTRLDSGPALLRPDRIHPDTVLWVVSLVKESRGYRDCHTNVREHLSRKGPPRAPSIRKLVVVHECLAANLA